MNDAPAVRRILASLPAWFGIQEAVEAYVHQAATQDSFLAVVHGDVVGVALVEHHFPEAAEISLLAVHAAHRGAGLGTALVTAVGQQLAAEGCRLLQVHTVGSSHEDPAYAQTRAFYLRSGFLPLQEFERIDWDGPTLVLVKPLVK